MKRKLRLSLLCKYGYSCCQNYKFCSTFSEAEKHQKISEAEQGIHGKQRGKRYKTPKVKFK